MTPLTFFQELHALDVILSPSPSGTLSYDAPQGVMTEGLIDALLVHKSALLDLVEEFEERAAIAEYCGGLSRTDANALAWESYAPIIPRPCWPHIPMKMIDGWRCTRCNSFDVE